MMSTELHTEVELKYRLKGLTPIENILHTLRNRHPSIEIKTLQQTNYFFDTEDCLLKQANFTLRLREENEAFKLTAKGKAPTEIDHDYISTRTELEIPLNAFEAQALLSLQLSPIDYLSQYAIKATEKEKNTLSYLINLLMRIENLEEINIIGFFSNLRLAVPIHIHNSNFTLELDTTTFSSTIIHYEAELELPMQFPIEKAEAFLLRLFADAHVSYEKSCGKSDRFYSYLRQ